MPTKPPIPRKTGPSIRDTNSVFERETRRIIERNFTKIADGVLLQNVRVTTTSTRVPHTLGRPYVGFLVVGKTETGDVWLNATDVNRPEEAIPLIADTTLTITLWVF